MSLSKDPLCIVYQADLPAQPDAPAHLERLEARSITVVAIFKDEASAEERIDRMANDAVWATGTETRMASSWKRQKFDDGGEWYLRFSDGRHGIIGWQRKVVDGAEDDLQGKWWGGC